MADPLQESVSLGVSGHVSCVPNGPVSESRRRGCASATNGQPQGRSSMHDRDEQRDTEHTLQESGGGARYQEAHRQHAVERDGPSRSREARGTGPDHAAPRSPAGTDTRPEHRDGQPDASGPSPNDATTADHRQVTPHPDDESWLNDLGFPKTGEHVEGHQTQIEHGPNAGGTQQGDPQTPESGAARSRKRSS
jgi:hypothetical protein